MHAVIGARPAPAIELSVGGVTRILHGGRPTLGPYEVFVRHGFLRGMPGTDESLSIERQEEGLSCRGTREGL
jgi:hypothetical protein